MLVDEDLVPVRIGEDEAGRAGARLIGLLVQVMGGALAENLGREDRDPGVRFGLLGKQVVAAAIGFGMGGISAEFAPIDITWPFALLIAVVAEADQPSGALRQRTGSNDQPAAPIARSAAT